MTDASCTGSEDSLHDCTFTTYSLQEGKDLLSTTAVAGVKCYTPDACVTPPTGGVSCNHGDVRQIGGSVGEGNGNVQYCYYGTWSPFCSLGPNEATVACRQLGFTSYDCKWYTWDRVYYPLLALSKASLLHVQLVHRDLICLYLFCSECCVYWWTVWAGT